MPVTVDEREMPDAGPGEIVSHPLRFRRGRKGVINERLVTAADRICGNSNIQGAVVRPVITLGRSRRRRRPAVVETDKIIVNPEYPHVDLTGPGLGYRQCKDGQSQ